MNNEPEHDDTEESDGLAWVGAIILVFAIGVTKLVADLTPDVHGPGWIAFAASVVVGEVVFGAFRRRQRGGR